MLARNRRGRRSGFPASREPFWQFPGWTASPPWPPAHHQLRLPTSVVPAARMASVLGTLHRAGLMVSVRDVSFSLWE